MNKPVLVVMAAGMGSRYGGMKQIDPVGRNGQVIVDYSLYDARRAGFETVIFVIKREIAEYQAAGLTENQIAELVLFDEKQFRNDRRYRMHTQEFCESDFDDDEGGDNGKSPLYEKYMEQLTVSINDEKVSADRYGWIEDIKNTELYTALSNMSEERMDLLTSVVFEGKSITEIAKEKGLSVSAITQRMGTIKKYLKKFSGQP